MTTFTKSNLTAALVAAEVAIPRKANLTTLQALHDALPVAQQLCPSCGIHLSNGILHPGDEVANKPGVTLHMEGMTSPNECMGCGHQWGTPIAPYAPASSTATGTGLKIEKDRPEQNGIKRPSVGGKCREIWDALDAYRTEEGAMPDSKLVKKLAEANGWNPNNASIEFYQWRKYHGVTGRA